MAFFFQSREMPIQTKSTQAREKRKLIRSSIFFCDSFFECVCVCHFISALRLDQSRWVCVGTTQWQRTKQGSVGVIWAQQDSSSGKDNSWRWRRSAGGDVRVGCSRYKVLIESWQSLTSTPSVCSKCGLLQTKVWPVDREALASLSSRVQAKPAEGNKMHSLKRLHVHKLLRLCLSTNMTSLKWKVLITLRYGDFEMCQCCCRSDVQHSWKLMGFSKWTHLLKYSTSLSVSSISVLSRSMSLGRKTSSMARQVGTCYVMLFLSFIVNDNAKNNKCNYLFRVNPFS